MSLESQMFLVGIVLGAIIWNHIRDLRHTYVYVKTIEGEYLKAQLHRQKYGYVDGEIKKVADVTIMIRADVDMDTIVSMERGK